MSFIAIGIAFHTPKTSCFDIKVLALGFETGNAMLNVNMCGNSKEEFLTSMYAVCNKMRKCYVGNNNIKYCNWRMKNKARSLRLLNICLASLDASLNLDTGFPGTS